MKEAESYNWLYLKIGSPAAIEQWLPRPTAYNLQQWCKTWLNKRLIYLIYLIYLL